LHVESCSHLFVLLNNCMTSHHLWNFDILMISCHAISQLESYDRAVCEFICLILFLSTSKQKESDGMAGCVCD